MQLEIDETERLELRRALMERKDELDKIRKKAEEKGLFGAVVDIRHHVAVIDGSPDGEEPGLLAKLADPRTEGAQKSIFDGGDQDIDREIEDGLLDGIEEEAAAIILEREKWSAFVGALPEAIEVDGEKLTSDDVTDDDLALHIAEAWHDQVGPGEDGDFAGLYIHETQSGDDVYCYLASGPEPAFYYDIEPHTANIAERSPTVTEPELLEWARRAYWPDEYTAATETTDEVVDEEQAATEAAQRADDETAAEVAAEQTEEADAEMALTE